MLPVHDVAVMSPVLARIAGACLLASGDEGDLAYSATCAASDSASCPSPFPGIIASAPPGLPQRYRCIANQLICLMCFDRDEDDTLGSCGDGLQ